MCEEAQFPDVTVWWWLEEPWLVCWKPLWKHAQTLSSVDHSTNHCRDFSTFIFSIMQPNTTESLKKEQNSNFLMPGDQHLVICMRAAVDWWWPSWRRGNQHASEHFCQSSAYLNCYLSAVSIGGRHGPQVEQTLFTPSPVQLKQFPISSDAALITTALCTCCECAGSDAATHRGSYET